MDNYIPHNTANEQAKAYWTDPRNFPTYKPPRTRIEKLINPQTRAERRRAARFRGIVGAVALMAMMPPNDFKGGIYNG
jgi:ferric-dicitrate binding protein FerR (iron transport regulator)